MAKQYGIKFGSGALSATSGLAPTFTHFVRLDTGTTLTPPGITQIIPGIGIYKFAYTPSFPVYFEIDGATSGLGNDRYITGMVDRIDQVDEDTLATGTTLVAFSADAFLRIGQTTSLIGDSATDPGSIFGYLKRLREFNEGNSTYTKASGVWAITSRGSTALVSKTLADTATTVTKT